MSTTPTMQLHNNIIQVSNNTSNKHETFLSTNSQQDIKLGFPRSAILLRTVPIIQSRPVPTNLLIILTSQCAVCPTFCLSMYRWLLNCGLCRLTFVLESVTCIYNYIYASSLLFINFFIIIYDERFVKAFIYSPGAPHHCQYRDY